MNTAILALEDGKVFYGKSIGVEGNSVGEVVFNTSMTGYQEILSDPSYLNQIITLTYPHIGNTGVNTIDNESNNIYATGLIIRDLPILANNWRQEKNLSSYLKQHNIVAISDIDTRALTRYLRNNGSLKGCIATNINKEHATDLAKKWYGIQNTDLAQIVSTKKQYTFATGSYDLKYNKYINTKAKYKVVVYDYGVKNNILRMLVDRNCELIIVNAKTPATEVLKLNPDGVFLSNGPGDPSPCNYAIKNIKHLLTTNIPIFGICLGHQLLALAVGCSSIKMKFGHHGANHPVKDLTKEIVLITSQNHSFTIDKTNDNVTITHKSLFDNSIQGIKVKNKPAFGFQGHPEASPGPQDSSYLFDNFIISMQ